MDTLTPVIPRSFDGQTWTVWVLGSPLRDTRNRLRRFHSFKAAWKAGWDRVFEEQRRVGIFTYTRSDTTHADPKAPPCD